MTFTASAQTPAEISDPGGDPTAGQPEIPPRHAALMEAAARLRTRPGLRLPVDRVLLAVASVLVPLGVVLIILGWEGAAHTGKQYEQIDYLISGGLLGATLSLLGGLIYFGYWLTRQLEEARRQSGLVMQAFSRLEAAVEGGALVAAERSAPPSTRKAAASSINGRQEGRRAKAADGAPMMLATARGTLLHRPECPIVANRQGTRKVAAGTTGYRYCSMCDSEALLA
ncbi:MAG: hypothetical protein ACR2KC_01005 [Acidimicrobiales bacterium]